MNESHFDSFGKLFDYIYKGDESAKSISLELVSVANKWDDLVDGDHVSIDDINKTFISCLFGMQQNPLWLHCGLNHQVLNCFLRWRDANTMESDKSSTDEDLTKCYMLRAGIYDLFVIIAYHLFGDEWAAEIGPVVRRYYGETPKEFIEEVRNA